MLPHPVVTQVSGGFAAFHQQLWQQTGESPLTVFPTFVSLMQDVHSDQVQRSKCNTSTLGAPLQAGLETETGMELVLCVSTAKQLVPKTKLLLFGHYKTLLKPI